MFATTVACSLSLTYCICFHEYTIIMYSVFHITRKRSPIYVLCLTNYLLLYRNYFPLIVQYKPGLTVNVFSSLAVPGTARRGRSVQS
jgi:hypothetical protein